MCSSACLYYEQGYKQKDAYIATQGPLKNTVEDLWKMMWEYQCGCIVMLCQLMEDGQVLVIYNLQRQRLVISLGEQLLLLAKRGGGGDGVWRVEGETDKRGELW